LPALRPLVAEQAEAETRRAVLVDLAAALVAAGCQEPQRLVEAERQIRAMLAVIQYRLQIIALVAEVALEL